MLLKPRRRRVTFMWNAKKNKTHKQVIPFIPAIVGSLLNLYTICVLFNSVCIVYVLRQASSFLCCSTSCFLDWGFPLQSRDSLQRGGSLRLLAIFHRHRMTKFLLDLFQCYFKSSVCFLACPRKQEKFTIFLFHVSGSVCFS